MLYKKKRMKIVTREKYGSPQVLKLKCFNTPKPKSNEVLIKIKASAVTRADTLIRNGKPKFARLFLGVFKPKVNLMGTGFSGDIVAIGNEVKLFKVGDAVFGESTLNFGANAEYICISEDALLLKKPLQLNYKQASTMCDGPLTSLNFLERLGKLQSGQYVLINGASGSLGSAAVQLAKQMGAYVVGVCSTPNLEFVKGLGADHVINYTTTHFTSLDHSFDLIYDAVGKSSFNACKNILKPSGKYLSPVLSLNLLRYRFYTSIIGRKKALFSATGMLPKEAQIHLLKVLLQIVKEHKLDIKIDRTYTLEEIVEAHAYVEEGHKKGNVVISNH